MALKANELRIGNLVKDRGNKILRIDWFEKNIVCQSMTISNQSVHPLTEDYEYLQPIPLTEEWLLRFEFAYIYNANMLFKKVSKSNPERNIVFIVFIVSIRDDKNEMPTRVLDDNEVEYIFIKMPEHVHTFQNIVHALTGEELTVKE